MYARCIILLNIASQDCRITGPAGPRAEEDREIEEEEEQTDSLLLYEQRAGQTLASLAHFLLIAKSLDSMQRIRECRAWETGD